MHRTLIFLVLIDTNGYDPKAENLITVSGGRKISDYIFSNHSAVHIAACPEEDTPFTRVADVWQPRNGIQRYGETPKFS